MKSKPFLYGLAWLGTLLATSVAQAETSANEWDAYPQALAKINAPVFPDREFVITDFGAKEGGEALCGEAIERAIAACSKAGGGKVVVPAGRFLTGPIHLQSNVNLVVSKGATLLFSTNFDDYLPMVYTRWEGVECYNYSPFIYAFEQENIAITGEGTLDGQAGWDNWWAWKRKRDEDGNQLKILQDGPRAEMFEKAERGVPVAERRLGAGHYMRPNFVQPYRCKNVLIEGVTILRSPMWVLNPVLCRNVTVRGVTVNSHGPNNDGCDPESSQDVLIEDCVFDTGDDCIAIKSGRNNDGRRVGVASKNIIVRNCVMKDGHGGVVIGSEISGGCRNVFVEDCQMSSPNLDRALRIKTNSIRGGVVENVFVRNVQVGQVGDAVLKVNFHYEEGNAGEHLPIVRNIVVRNLISKKSPRALDIRGYEESPITNIRLIDCQFEGVEQASVLINVKGLILDNVNMNTGRKTDLWGNPL